MPRTRGNGQILEAMKQTPEVTGEDHGLDIMKASSAMFLAIVAQQKLSFDVIRRLWGDRDRRRRRPIPRVSERRCFTGLTHHRGACHQ